VLEEQILHTSRQPCSFPITSIPFLSHPFFIAAPERGGLTKSPLKFVAAPSLATKLYTLTDPFSPYARSKTVPPIVTLAMGVNGYPLAERGDTPPKTPSQTMTSKRLEPLAEEPRNMSYATSQIISFPIPSFSSFPSHHEGRNIAPLTRKSLPVYPHFHTVGILV
jgi:hypothetical protein